MVPRPDDDPTRTLFVDLACSVDVERIASRIKAGASANAADSNGYTLLHWLAWQTDYDSEVLSDALHQAILLLLESGASPHARTDSGDTPLHLATDGDGPNLTAVRLLLRFGATANTTNSYGRTPLHGAVEQSSLACTRSLLEAGAEWTLRDASGDSPADLARSTVEVREECVRNPADLGPYLGPQPELRKREVAESMQRSLFHARAILALASDG